MPKLAIHTCAIAVLTANQLHGQAEWENVQLNVGELTFDAIVAGPPEGELVVLLHGFPQNFHEFRHQIPILTEMGFRVVAPNQRGYSPGARPTEVEAYATRFLVDDVIGIVDALERDDFHVVGHDWGSVVAWFTAMTYPTRVQSVFAISIAHPFAYAEALQSTNGEQQASSAYMEAFRAPDAESRLLADDAALLRGVFSSAGIETSDVDVYIETLATPAALRSALNWYRAMGSNTGSRALTPIRMPATYVWGTEDPVMSRHGAELTANYVEGPYRFEALDGIGHWIPEQASSELNQLLEVHFREHIRKATPS